MPAQRMVDVTASLIQDSEMNTKLAKFVSFLGCLIVLQNVTAMAEDSDLGITLSTGVDFTTGNYGGDVDIEDVYVPLTANFDYGRIAYRLTVPYLSVRAPEGTVFDAGGEPVPGSGAMTTESGLGDIIGSATLYDVISNRQLGFAMDLTAKVKFGTADEAKGLGTGENDYSVQADFFKDVDQLTWIGSVGYTLRGDPTGIDLENVFMASVGGTYKFTPDVKSGLFFDYRESALAGSDDIQELSGFVSRRISDDWRIQVYALTGLSDSSPDLGGGLRIKRVVNR